MRRKTFDLRERLVLIPVELTIAFKWGLIISVVFFFLGGFSGLDWSWDAALEHGLFAVLAVFSAIFAGAVLTPLLLPWLPGRAFSFKGMTAGMFTALVLVAFRIKGPGALLPDLELLGWIFIALSFSAYLAMNFTGASTFTSLSGVRKEMKWAVPLEIIGGSTGICLWLCSLFINL
jgi:acetyl-CoA decarbonylase/synthase complex subunit gamma